MECSICKNTENNEPLIFHEKMFAMNESFKYFRCPKCGCIQIAQNIENIGHYYPKNYYSFSEGKGFLSVQKDKLENWILKNIALNRLNRSRCKLISSIASSYKEHWEYYFEWLDSKYFHINNRILDIGCGSGTLLKRLACTGFKNLQGIDPFIEKDIQGEGYSVAKKNMFDLKEKYDVIMLHHSFEHMDNPHEVMEQLKAVLAENGTILIRIPVADCFAYQQYKENWFQIDAPRHFFLHTRKSMHLLAEAHGFMIDKMIDDSTGKQFVYSERYAKGLTLNDNALSFSRSQQKEFREKAKSLNLSNKGDQTCFFLKVKQ